jgi:hypothetical protein
MHGTTAGRLALPHLGIVNPLERFVGAEDQTSNKPADMLKSFSPTKDLPKAFHSLDNGLWHTGDRQHGSTFLFLFPHPLFFHHPPVFPNNLPTFMAAGSLATPAHENLLDLC